MKPVWYWKYESIARANQLTSTGRRKLRRRMRSDFRNALRKARAVTERYAGKKLTLDTLDLVKADLIAAFTPPEELEFNLTFSDGNILNVAASGAINVLRDWKERT